MITIYNPYSGPFFFLFFSELNTKMSNKNQYVDPTGRMAESTMRIQDLHQAEKVKVTFKNKRD